MKAAPSPQMVQSAADRVYAAWLPHVGDAGAREQADAFARRFHILLDGPLCPRPTFKGEPPCATTA
jgi:hypothetical protein